jgi:hypothetical protein
MDIFFLHHFPVRSAGLLSLYPGLLRLCRWRTIGYHSGEAVTQSDAMATAVWGGTMRAASGRLLVCAKIRGVLGTVAAVAPDAERETLYVPVLSNQRRYLVYGSPITRLLASSSASIPFNAATGSAVPVIERPITK